MRVGLVTRNPALSLALGSVHDVEEVRPEDLSAWLTEAAIDVVVLDAKAPDEARSMMSMLEHAGRREPVIVTPAGAPGLDRPGVLEMRGVLSRNSLRDSLESAAEIVEARKAAAAEPSDPGQAPTEGAEPPGREVPGPRSTAPPEADQAPGARTSAGRKPRLGPRSERSSKPAPLQEPDSSPRPRAPSDLGEPRTQPPEPEHVVRHPGQSEPRRSEPRGKSKPSSRRPRHEATPPPRPSGALGVHQPDDASVATLLRGLHARAGEIFGVRETAQAIAESACERVRAEETAVLVPDALEWRTSGGVGLRSLERRTAIGGDHWLVGNIVTPRRGMIVEHSDIVRRQLMGAPLASRNHLLAVPVPEVAAIVIAARDREEPFTEDDLAALVDLADEARSLLRDAMEVRAIARELSRFAEPPGE